MTDCVVFVGKSTSLVIDNLCTRNGILDTLKQRVLVIIGRSTAVVSVEKFNIIGIRTNDCYCLDIL